MDRSLRVCGAATLFWLAVVLCYGAGPTYTTIFSFPFMGQPGSKLNSKPLEGSDGALYGTTAQIFTVVPNRPDGSGLIYRMNKDGTGYTVLHRFEETYGPKPGALIESRERELWGTTGRIGAGTLFKMNLDGSGFTTLHVFNVRPNGSLLEGRDGAIYGAAGDEEYRGLIYRINKDGSGFTVWHQYGLTEPTGSLIESADGFLYGTTKRGGITNKGSIFRISKDGTGYTTLYSFIGDIDGEHPHAGVIEGKDAVLYGTTGGLGFEGHGSVYKINKDGTGFTVLRSSDPMPSGVYRPGVAQPPRPPSGMVLEDLIEGSDGALYASGIEKLESVIFKVSKDGSDYNVLRNLSTVTPYDQGPRGLIEGSDGELYGTIEGGGYAGSGTVFKISKSGTDYVELRTFDGWGAKGIFPGSLIYGRDDVLYGASAYGGSNQVGALYKVNTTGSDFRVIYNFTGGADGAGGSLLFHGLDGLLYGVADYGRMLFRLNAEGDDFQVLHLFTNGEICGGVIEGPDGLLYGAAKGAGLGAQRIPNLFKMNKDGSGYQTFYTFGARALFNIGFDFLLGSDGYIYGAGNDMFELFRFQVGGIGLETLVATSRQVSGFRAPSLFEGLDGAIYSVWPAEWIARIEKDGSNLRLLYHVTDEVAGATWPRIHEGPDGFIYGSGTPSRPGPGTIFRLAKDGTAYTNLFTYPMAGTGFPTFIKGGPADFYGVTTAGGPDNLGTIYRLHVPIGAPVLAARSTGTNEVVLSWESSDRRVTEFLIYRKTGKAGVFEKIAVVGKDVREWRDTGAALLTPYTYLILATDGAAYSDYSNPATITIGLNVLFIAVDDLNHWVGHLGRNPQAKTPNIDRLARMGVTFANAHCASPVCNPSRAALMSGRRPGQTGIYNNGQDWKPAIRKEETLTTQFIKAGYNVFGAGKIYHSGEHREREWTDYFNSAGGPPLQRHVSAKDTGLDEIQFYPLANKDADMTDYRLASYAIEKLAARQDKPFFLALGFTKPHMPWAVPKKYFDRFPLETIRLPRVKNNDLADVPPPGAQTADWGRFHAKVVKTGRWKEAIQGYLATIAFVDAQIGRVLDAFQNSPHRNNTVIVLWGDNGWHLGEKQHWRKFALWEEATRTPFIWVAPGVTQAGGVCERPVDLMSVYPTLLELCGIPKPAHVVTGSISPLLADPTSASATPAITTFNCNNHAIRSERWRYIRYASGNEELYDHQTDPYEWTNVAARVEYAPTKAELARWLPKENAPARRP